VVPGATRHGQPQTHIDEQPAGSTPDGRGVSVPAGDPSRAPGCLSAVAKLGDTVPDQRLKNGGVLMHGSSFRQDFL
jgi:hypothetical protein